MASDGHIRMKVFNQHVQWASNKTLYMLLESYYLWWNMLPTRLKQSVVGRRTMKCHYLSLNQQKREGIKGSSKIIMKTSQNV